MDATTSSPSKPMARRPSRAATLAMAATSFRVSGVSTRAAPLPSCLRQQHSGGGESMMSTSLPSSPAAGEHRGHSLAWTRRSLTMCRPFMLGPVDCDGEEEVEGTSSIPSSAVVSRSSSRSSASSSNDGSDGRSWSRSRHDVPSSSFRRPRRTSCKEHEDAVAHQPIAAAYGSTAQGRLVAQPTKINLEAAALGLPDLAFSRPADAVHFSVSQRILRSPGGSPQSFVQWPPPSRLGARRVAAGTLSSGLPLGHWITEEETDASTKGERGRAATWEKSRKGTLDPSDCDEVLSPQMTKSWSFPSTHIDAALTTNAKRSSREELKLQEAVKKRANEQCMVLLQKNLWQRMQLRIRGNKASRPTHGGGSNFAFNRQQVTSLANNFDATYANTQEAMKGKLTFRIPMRAHTLVEGQLHFHDGEGHWF